MKLKDAEINFKIAQENLQTQKDKLIEMMVPIKSKFNIQSVTELENAELELKQEVIEYIRKVKGIEKEEKQTELNKEEFKGL